jgi:hypothetical protein
VLVLGLALYRVVGRWLDRRARRGLGVAADDAGLKLAARDRIEAVRRGEPVDLEALGFGR